MAVRVSTCRKMVTLFVKGAESILSNGILRVLRVGVYRPLGMTYCV
jgi:hypothetical protein